MYENRHRLMITVYILILDLYGAIAMMAKSWCLSVFQYLNFTIVERFQIRIVQLHNKVD